MSRIEQIIEQEEIACEYTTVPAYLHAPVTGSDADEIKRLRQDARLARELGFEAAFVDEVPSDLHDQPVTGVVTPTQTVNIAPVRR
jgi:hypothetical protein